MARKRSPEVKRVIAALMCARKLTWITYRPLRDAELAAERVYRAADEPPDGDFRDPAAAAAAEKAWYAAEAATDPAENARTAANKDLDAARECLTLEDLLTCERSAVRLATQMALAPTPPAPKRQRAHGVLDVPDVAGGGVMAQKRDPEVKRTLAKLERSIVSAWDIANAISGDGYGPAWKSARADFDAADECATLDDLLACDRPAVRAAAAAAAPAAPAVRAAAAAARATAAAVRAAAAAAARAAAPERARRDPASMRAIRALELTARTARVTYWAAKATCEAAGQVIQDAINVASAAVGSRWMHDWGDTYGVWLDTPAGQAAKAADTAAMPIQYATERAYWSAKDDSKAARACPTLAHLLTCERPAVREAAIFALEPTPLAPTPTPPAPKRKR